MKKSLLLLSILFLFGCEKVEKKKAVSHFQGIQMTIPYHVQIGEALTTKQKKSVDSIILNTFKKTNSTYNIWNRDSEIAKLNRLPSHKQCMVSEDLYQLLKRSKFYLDLTEGKFDISAGSLISLWKHSLRNGQVPDTLSIQNCPVGFELVHLQDGWFMKESNNLELDIDGVVKGTTVDLLIKALNDEGYFNVYVDWGGDIRVSGIHPENRPWNVVIANPLCPEGKECIDFVPLKDEAIATSGDYYQKYKVDGVQYFHITDPKTKQALQITQSSIASATVVAPTCEFADTLATTLMLFDDINEARDFATQIEKDFPGVKFWITSHKEKKMPSEKAVIFDMGNVLFSFDHNKMNEQIALICGLETSLVNHELFIKGLLKNYENGEMTSLDLFKHFENLATLPVSYEEFMVETSNIFEPIEETIDLLTTLKKAGCRLVLLSNTSETHFNYCRKKFPALDLFDAYTLSYEVGASKPALKIFETALKQTGCKKENCFYVDDIAQYINVAKKYGIDGHHFDKKSPNDLISALVEKGFLNK